jgi:PIN domain nuclease of toxin-antitoxin system
LTSLLLDTHALLWSVGDVDRLPPTVYEVLRAAVAPAYVSAASIWEIAIKHNSGKLQTPDNLLEKIALARFEELKIDFQDAALAGRLPAHHKDPFDRMIVAQAQRMNLTVVTRDARIAAYEVPVLW